MRIGVIGWHTDTGLGIQTEDLARALGARWLIPQHPQREVVDVARRRDIEHRIFNPCKQRRIDPETAKWFFRGLDWVLFAEQPFCSNTVELARKWKVKTACYVNWEWFPPKGFGCDLYLAPTQDTFSRLKGDPAARGAGVAYAPMAVDTDRFRFRLRATARRFVFAEGTGGAYGRKGAHAVAAAAAQTGLPFIVYSQRGQMVAGKAGPPPQWPDNCELRGAADRPEDIYAEGDIYVAPSRFEGVGLPMLEAQACGMPLITTAGPPMNEYRPMYAVQATKTKVRVRREVDAYDVYVEGLAATLRDVHGKEIRERSSYARHFIEKHHSWRSTGPMLFKVLEGYS